MKGSGPFTGRSYGPHDTPGAPPTGPEIDVRWEGAYRIDPNASVADYARYDLRARGAPPQGSSHPISEEMSYVDSA